MGPLAPHPRGAPAPRFFTDKLFGALAGQVCGFCLAFKALQIGSESPLRSSARPKKVCNPTARWKFPGSLHKKAMAFPLINWFPHLGGSPCMRFARPIAMPDQFPIFEKLLNKRSRTWRRRGWTTEGDVLMQGSERSRPADTDKDNSA